MTFTEKIKPDLGPSGEWYIVKSEPRGAYVIVKPAITPANDRIACAVAGSAGGEVKCLPLTPSATTKATSTGNQITRSNHMSTVYPQNETCGESQGGFRDDHTQEKTYDQRNDGDYDYPHTVGVRERCADKILFRQVPPTSSSSFHSIR